MTHVTANVYHWRRLKDSRRPCVRACGRNSQRPDGVCWRCAEKERRRTKTGGAA